MLTYTYQHRVRYRECDPMGVVYHTHYIDHFEAARTEALRSLGMTYKELEASGVMLVVIDLGVQYRRPAFYDDLLEIEVQVEDDALQTRMRFDYAVRRAGKPKVLITGHVTLCFIDAARRRPIPPPDTIVAVFARAKAARTDG